jgi:ADP-ribose pyrophosphatase
VGTRRPFKDKVFALREDDVELPGGKRKSIAYLERTPAVIVVPVTPEEEIVLINHYRHPVDEWCLEVPAGGVDDAPNESLAEAARRELLEEVGGSCQSLTYVAGFHSANSLTNETCHVFLAERVGLQKPDRGAAELMETRGLPAAEVVALVRGGRMMDGQCALAILLCEPLLRGKSYLGASQSA